MPKQRGQKVLQAMFQDPKPFESTSGKPIEAAGRLLIVNQEGSQAERFDMYMNTVMMVIVIFLIVNQKGSQEI